MRYCFRKIGGLLISRDGTYNRDSPIDKGGLCILQSACITRCVYTERERGAREFTRHAPSGQPRMRTATRDVPNDVAVWNDEWRPEDEKQGDAGRVCRAKSSRECAEWLAVSRRLAYRRVSLHSEVSCRCGLTGSPCSRFSRYRPHRSYHCSVIVQSPAAAHIVCYYRYVTACTTPHTR